MALTGRAPSLICASYNKASSFSQSRSRVCRERASINPPCESHFQVSITASAVSELAAGVGHYLRDVCNFTIEWPRGGGSNIFIPDPWPKIGTPIGRRRLVCPFAQESVPARALWAGNSCGNLPCQGQGSGLASGAMWRSF